MTFNERLYAIFKCFYFGLLPSWWYEKDCHYANSAEGEVLSNYFEHLKMNLLIVKHLIVKTEHPSTHRFHKMKIRKWVRWQY